MTNTNTKEHTDIKQLHWLEGFLPPKARPYIYLMRLDRPVGIWLLLLPALWSIALASGGVDGITFKTVQIIIMFMLGAIIMRGAGCVMNDLWDRNLDKMVERTKNRPIANGAISVKNALIFLSTLLLIGFILLLKLSNSAVFIGFATLPLIAIYPLMKRITWWPQLFLGITFNVGALMGWAAVKETISLSATLIYIGGVLWTLAYDTIYAHQDKEDDALIGIKSTARLFKNYSKFFVFIFYILAFLMFTCAFVSAQGLHPRIVFFAVPFFHIIYKLYYWNTNNPSSSLSTFKSNQVTGLMILICYLFPG